MSILEQLPGDVESLKNIVMTSVARFMASNQTVQELMRDKTELRAALHLMQADKTQLESQIQSLVSKVSAVVSEPVVDLRPVSAPVDNSTGEQANADTVPA